MNMSAESAAVNTAANENRTGIGALSQAIRRSMIFFLLASVLLIVALLLIINRFGVSSAISDLNSTVDDLDIKVLEMRTVEKDFQSTSSESYVIQQNKLFEDADVLMNSITNNSVLGEETKDFSEQVGGSLAVYKNLFGQAVSDYTTRGFDAETGIRKELREVSVEMTEEIGNLKSPATMAALLAVRNNVKDFVIFETRPYIQPALAAFEQLDTALVENGTEEAQHLREDVTRYQDAFNRYTVATLDANQAFADSTIASNATINPIPTFRERLKELQGQISTQFLYILAAIAFILISIFLIVIFQLRRAQSGATQTLDETRAAQKAAEDENEQLNDSVINILQAVSSLSDRDLTARAPVTEDVIGTVSDSINLLADETSTVLKDVTNIAGQVSTVSDTVRTQAVQVSQTAEEERSNVQSMIETLFDATQTMNQVAALAEQSNESAAQATEVTESALETVNKTVGGMESIRETISETEKRIKRLGERSQEISGIVNLINTISERTHVLALNASMQAAVAGEAGRGFAVVAEEVQQLAESSRNATEQIATLVNNIQIETNETINTVNKTIGQVVEGSEQAQQAGEQMRRTQEITAELVSRVQNIAQASEQQKEMSANLLEAVQAIGESTEKTAQQIDAQNAGTEELQKAAKQLVDSVNVFKLPA